MSRYKIVLINRDSEVGAHRVWEYISLTTEDPT